jgi:hypothetical protein
MVYTERRNIDNGTITGNLVIVNWLGTGQKLQSTFDVSVLSGPLSLTVKVYRLDPGTGKKLGLSLPILSHAAIQATGLQDAQAIDPTSGSAPFTGLFRTEYVFSGPGTLTATHTLVCKD